VNLSTLAECSPFRLACKHPSSRNKVLNQLIEIGIEEALKALPSDVAGEIRAHAGKVIMDNVKNAETDQM